VSPVLLLEFQMAPRLSLFWVQDKGAQICMSEWSYSFTLTQNVDWGFFLCTTPPADGLIRSPFQQRCLLRVLCPVRRTLITSTQLNFWHRSFTFNSNKSPTLCNSFSVYYSDVCLQLNMFRAFSRPSSGFQWLQWKTEKLLHQVGDLFELYDDARAYKP